MGVGLGVGKREYIIILCIGERGGNLDVKMAIRTACMLVSSL